MNPQRARDIEALRKLWVSGMPTLPIPETAQWELWFKLTQDDFGTVCHGIQECVKLYARRRGVLEFGHAVKHASKVMNCHRRDRAKSNKPVQHWPLNILSKNLAEEVGLPPGLALTQEMFWRIHKRALAIQQGRVPAPSTATTDNDVLPETKKAA
jgi:hypothetical protein